jgi:nitrile hydratase
VEQILLRTGDLAEGELDAAVAAGRVPMERVDQPEVAALVPVLLHRSPAPARSERPAGRYAPGDRVRVARRVTSEHNRVPRYVRGATGVVESVAGDEPLEEGIDHGPPQPVYSVSFAADDLWADGADADVDVVLDLFETYLEPA